MFIDSIRTYDLAFLAMHGAGGEDGEIQHVLDYLGIPYTASNAFQRMRRGQGRLKAHLCQCGHSYRKGRYLEEGRPYNRWGYRCGCGEEDFNEAGGKWIELRHLSC